MKYKPFTYQKNGIKHLLENPCSGLFLDPGEGKTSISLAYLSVLKDKGELSGALVVMTKNILDFETWQNEIKKWDEFSEFTYTVLHGKDKLKNLKKNVDIYFINYEGLFWLFDNRKYLGCNVIILDESSKIKSYSTKRFKLLKKWIADFERRHILTGTPNPKSYMDLFSQIYFLDAGHTLGKYITHYRNEYFNPTGYKGYVWEIKKGSDKKIEKKISKLIYRPDKDYLRIPKEKVNDIIIKLNSNIKKKYNELENFYYTNILNDAIVANNAAAATQKLRQFSNGSVYNDTGGITNIHDYKVNMALEIVEELQGNSVLIGYEFRSDLEKLLKVFPDAPYIGTRISGKKTSKKDKISIQRKWNTGDIPILLGQISSMAHGLNLQGYGHNIIFYSLVWNLEDYIQFIRRLRRQGQKKRVNVYRLICDDTIDFDVINALNEKDRSQKNLLNAMRKRCFNKYGK